MKLFATALAVSMLLAGSAGAAEYVISATAGSTGTDYSINAAAVPVSGLTLLQTVAATPSRNAIEIQNQSAGSIQIVRDDGANSAPSSILLGSGGSQGAQGGGWSSTTFKGRLRIYGAPGAQIAIFQD